MAMTFYNHLNSHLSSNMTENTFSVYLPFVYQWSKCAEKVFLDKINIHMGKTDFLLLYSLAGLSNNQLKALRLKEKLARGREDNWL